MIGCLLLVISFLAVVDCSYFRKIQGNLKNVPFVRDCNFDILHCATDFRVHYRCGTNGLEDLYEWTTESLITT